MRLWPVAPLLLLCSPIQADVVNDQSQIGFYSSQPLYIGGSSRQELAQTFTPSLSGRLSHVSFVVQCEEGSPGTVGISIHTVDAEGVPEDFSIGASVRPASELASASPGWQVFFFSNVDLIAGEQYAMAVRGGEDVDCVSFHGAGDAGPFGYSGGQAFYKVLPNPPLWYETTPDSDFSFYTYMFDGVPNVPAYCEFEDANGVANDWLPNFVPACGCLTDPQLRVNRCWFSLPEFVLWREMLLPFEQPNGKAYWHLTPLNSNLTEVGIDEFAVQGRFKIDPVLFTGNLKAGETLISSATYYGSTDRTEVTIHFETSEGSGEVTFDTLFTDPDE